MKSIIIAGVLAIMGLPAQAGTSVAVFVGGGGAHFQGNYFSASGSRCAYSAGCYNPYRSFGYVGYPGYGYTSYGYYGGYAPAYYPSSYEDVSYVQPSPGPTAPAPAPASQAPVATPTPAPAAPTMQAPLLFGILDVNGFVHSPYSDAIFKVPGVRNAQLVYDPVTGKPFLVR